jgi:hypothetical protein
MKRFKLKHLDRQRNEPLPARNLQILGCGGSLKHAEGL